MKKHSIQIFINWKEDDSMAIFDKTTVRQFPENEIISTRDAYIAELLLNTIGKALSNLKIEFIDFFKNRLNLEDFK